MVQPRTQRQKMIRLLTQLGAGAIVGYLAGHFFLGELEPDVISLEAFLLAMIGMIYGIIGISLGVGLLAPKLVGARLLNVEDADELNEQRRILTGSSIGMTAIGAALALLAMSGPGGMVPPIAGFGAITASLAIVIIISIRDWKYYDELILRMTLEASYLAFSVFCFVMWLWCAAAWVGWTAAPAPLAILALISGLYLLAICVVAARRGMMAPR